MISSIWIAVVVTLLFVLGPCYIFCQHEEYKQRIYQRTIHETLRSRRRSLTWPPASSGFAERWISDQSQSFLLRLPLEIREQIYNIVIGQEGHDGRVVHIITRSKDCRLQRVRCWASDEFKEQTLERFHRDGRLHGYEHKCWPVIRADGSCDGYVPPEDNLLPFLLTCHRIYSEAIDILYSHNTFSFRNCASVLHLSRAIPSSRLHSMRHIDFSTDLPQFLHDTKTCACRSWLESYDTWVLTWQAVANMRGLRDLWVTFCYKQGRIITPGQDDEYVLRLLFPLTTIRVENFEVKLLWTLSASVKDQLGITPFRLLEHNSNDSAPF